MDKPTIYVVVNKSLGMSGGKVAAQVGHAVGGLFGRVLTREVGDLSMQQWLYAPHRWLIVLEAKNGEQLYHLHEYLVERLAARRVPTIFRVIDEGVNEIPPFSITALGVGPFDKDSAEAAYLSDLPLYEHIPSRNERAQIWDQAVDYMHGKSLWRRIRNR